METQNLEESARIAFLQDANSAKEEASPPLLKEARKLNEERENEVTSPLQRKITSFLPVVKAGRRKSPTPRSR